MSSASHREDLGSNTGKGQFFRIKMKNVTSELGRQPVLLKIKSMVCLLPNVQFVFLRELQIE